MKHIHFRSLWIGISRKTSFPEQADVFSTVFVLVLNTNVLADSVFPNDFLL